MIEAQWGGFEDRNGIIEKPLYENGGSWISGYGWEG